MVSTKAPSVCSTLPISRGSVIDSELSYLIHKNPKKSNEIIHGLLLDPARHQKGQHYGLANEKPEYSSEFYSKYGRPRSNKRPEEIAYCPVNQPMAGQSSQKQDFKTPDLREWQPPANNKVPPDNNDVFRNKNQPHDASGNTIYYHDYSNQERDHRQAEQGGTSTRGRDSPVELWPTNRVLVQDKPTNYTTENSYQFKNWRPIKAIQFGELPSFTRSVLAPNVRLSKESMQSEFTSSYRPLEHIKSVKMKPAPGNIEVSDGDHDFQTIMRASYPEDRFIDWNDLRYDSSKVSASSQPLRKKAEFYGQTQNMRDFPTYENLQRRQPLAPLKDNIVMKKLNPLTTSGGLSDTRGRLGMSETKSKYLGYDPLEFPVPAPYKPKQDDGALEIAENDGSGAGSKGKMAGLTVTMTDFQPIDLSQLTRANPVKASFNDKGRVILSNVDSPLPKTQNEDCYTVMRSNKDPTKAGKVMRNIEYGNRMQRSYDSSQKKHHRYRLSHSQAEELRRQLKQNNY